MSNLIKKSKISEQLSHQTAIQLTNKYTEQCSTSFVLMWFHCTPIGGTNIQKKIKIKKTISNTSKKMKEQKFLWLVGMQNGTTTWEDGITVCYTGKPCLWSVSV